VTLVSPGLAFVGTIFALGACRPATLASAEPKPSASAQAARPEPSAARAASFPTPATSVDHARYPWLAGGVVPGPVDTLESRFAAPADCERVPLEPGSFGAWLRGLPLTRPSTPVRAYDGSLVRPGSDPRVAAVVALDVGHADLQQCADTVVRLHAEWRWSEGQREHTYRAAAGTELGWGRFAQGERVMLTDGGTLQWVPVGKRAEDYASFRNYLDTVFAWLNTVSLARDTQPVPPGSLRPGDFFVLPGSPGHAVLVLDLARCRTKGLVGLLGQGFLPAQSAHVLGTATGEPWFVLDPTRAVETPFWRPFPWTSLRRLDA
jgi:hypothetical protein